MFFLYYIDIQILQIACIIFKYLILHILSRTSPRWKRIGRCFTDFCAINALAVSPFRDSSSNYGRYGALSELGAHCLVCLFVNIRLFIVCLFPACMSASLYLETVLVTDIGTFCSNIKLYKHESPMIQILCNSGAT